MKIEVSPWNGRISPSSPAALSSSLSAVVPIAMIRPPAALAAFKAEAVTAAALNAVRLRGGRIIAVGTTALRLLESAADEAGDIQPFSGETAIFITPGYRFRTAQGLVTNFHLPRSTLFMLVSAFSGLAAMRAAYAHAIADGYRFYSYGDASLLWRAGP